PKTADFAQFLPGMRQSYSKVFTALTGAPAQTVRRRPTSTGVSSRGRDTGRTFSPSSLAAWFQTAEEMSPLRKAEQARELELPTHSGRTLVATASRKAATCHGARRELVAGLAKRLVTGNSTLPHWHWAVRRP